ncbi:MAG: decarboxylating 6-phosphogluconate dehydrogenase [Peptoclostridium sp.]|uniref:phosphogluconate dehydrogenase (NAD(+)-dependent, decarboxylating) n=1 Tax=Peptoclostridium sp. TaxID=1904860 RepID=UPI00139BB751|nr:decarboxylating 6-phosphogluconate dehydrogenase [Peptoclostridium sp.]MZQ75501.1 decarboxylating 6-phosphogluconate dehydrogenase [Peptoclostridium sp.]
MKLGVVGLGKMGHNLVLNMMDKGHDVTAYDISQASIEAAEIEGIQTARSLQELCAALGDEKTVWIMVPAGEVVESIVEGLKHCMDQGDTIIDGGNSHYKDSIRRHDELRERGISFIDVGTSGGVEGARSGACMMIGGEEEDFKRLEALFEDLCVMGGCAYLGRSGSGHFAKMVHNGIEYGMLQAIGEGFEIIQRSGFEMDNEKLARVWSSGSVIRGWLMELCQRAFKNCPQLEGVKGKIASSGEGLWTVQEALELGVPASVITQSLLARYASNDDDSFSAKVVSALRREFGGHDVSK